MKRKHAIVLPAALVLAVGGTGIARALGGGESEKSATGPQADQAIAAALAVTGGGTANSVERDSEDGATWEVEVTKPDGRTVDVRLDASYELVKVEGDSEHADESGGDQEEPAG